MNTRLRFHLLTSLIVVFVATWAGCDSDPPAAGTPKQSVPEDQTTTVKESFQNVDGWETISGTWSPGMSDDRNVLKQTATDQKYPVILLKQPELSDVDVSVQFCPISGEVDASGGIIFRAQDGENYFIVRANSLEDNLRLYATVDGSRKQIASTTIDPPEIGMWHTLRVTAVDDHVQAYLNDKLLIDHHDDRFQSGRVGLWTKADAITEFADFKASGTATGSSE